MVVVYAEREDDLIRIIGARFATKGEQERYLEHKGRYKSVTSQRFLAVSSRVRFQPSSGHGWRAEIFPPGTILPLSGALLVSASGTSREPWRSAFTPCAIGSQDAGGQTDQRLHCSRSRHATQESS